MSSDSGVFYGQSMHGSRMDSSSKSNVELVLRCYCCETACLTWKVSDLDRVNNSSLYDLARRHDWISVYRFDGEYRGPESDDSCEAGPTAYLCTGCAVGEDDL